MNDSFEKWWEGEDYYTLGYDDGFNYVLVDPSPSMTEQSRREWITGYLDGLGDSGRTLVADSYLKSWGFR